MTSYSARRPKGHHAMDSLPTGSIQSWLIVAAVALSPVIVLFLAATIGRVRRRFTDRRPGIAPGQRAGRPSDSASRCSSASVTRASGQFGLRVEEEDAEGPINGSSTVLSADWPRWRDFLGQGCKLETVAGRRGWRFAQLSVRALSGLVYRLVALSSVVATPGGSAWFGTSTGSAGWGRSVEVRRASAIRGASATPDAPPLAPW
jgi:hypothetical protein